MSSLLANLNIDPADVQPLPDHLKPKKLERKMYSQAKLEQMLQDILEARFQPYKTITPELRDKVMSFVQHLASGLANPDWLHARLDLITGSILAGIVGWSPFSDQTRTTIEKLWRTFVGNAATRYGGECEHKANSSTEVYFESLNGTVNPRNPDEIQIRSTVRDVGLVRSVAFVFAGMSPDGILTRKFKNTKTGEIRVQRQLLEYKCPFKHRNLTDHWPAYDLYDKYPIPHVPGTAVNARKQPVPQYYYTQLLWGGLVMGSHKLGPMLAKSPTLAAYMEPHMERILAQHKVTSADDVPCGEDLIDVDQPILFIVWVPCTDLCKAVGDPDVYHEEPEADTRFIRTRHGAIQLTEVEYDHNFATWMLETVFDFWRNMLMPRVVMKSVGMLLPGEVDVPLELDSETEEDEEEDAQ